jgi:hypothetical protein
LSVQNAAAAIEKTYERKEKKENQPNPSDIEVQQDIPVNVQRQVVLL